MSTIEQVEDNISYMRDFQPLSPAEREAVDTVSIILRNQGLIPCTACRYCTEVCPQGIAIPEIFAALNAKRQEQTSAPIEGGMPGDCIKCGKCEKICPQNLNIRQLLVVASQEL